MILWLLMLVAWSQGSQYWLQLQQARLLLMDESQVNQSIDLLNSIIAQNQQDSDLLAEALYWKGHALYLQGFQDHSNEKLIEASNNYNMRSSALYFLQQSTAYEQRIQKIPYEGNPWVNIDGKSSESDSLMWIATFDAQAGSFRQVSMNLEGREFPIYLTVELVDWRNERWIWRDIIQDTSQPLVLRLSQFRTPRDENKYLYRNMMVTAESEDGRRVPFTIVNLEVQ